MHVISLAGTHSLLFRASPAMTQASLLLHTGTFRKQDFYLSVSLPLNGCAIVFWYVSASTECLRALFEWHGRESQVTVCATTCNMFECWRRMGQRLFVSDILCRPTFLNISVMKFYLVLLRLSTTQTIRYFKNFVIAYILVGISFPKLSMISRE